MKTERILAMVLTLGLGAPLWAAEEKPATTNDYPLTTCVVSGEKLGEMGAPVVIQYEGQEVRFCCKGCVKDFKADPEKYLAKLRAAKEAAGKAGKTGAGSVEGEAGPAEHQEGKHSEGGSGEGQHGAAPHDGHHH
jgi:YHS domain-containing protein